MAHITLVLPFALPAPEFAPDLVRALDTPTLAALLTRSRRNHVALDDAVRALPHERWLASALGLEHEGRPAFAAAAMRGRGLDPGGGTWFIVNPAHIQVARSHLMLADPRHLMLAEEEGRALFEAARPLLEESGHAVAYGDARTWFLRADDWTGIDVPTPDSAAGMDLTVNMPAGPAARAYRKLQNEIQMLWHGHPVNAAREARRLPVVNAFWMWSGSPGDARTRERTMLAAFEAPGWIEAMAARRLAAPADILAGADAILVCGNLAEAAIAADWSAWLGQMQRLETELFAPVHAALKDGRIKQVELVLSHRDACASFTTTAMAQRKFWRRPTLEALT